MEKQETPGHAAAKRAVQPAAREPGTGPTLEAIQPAALEAWAVARLTGTE